MRIFRVLSLFVFLSASAAHADIYAHLRLMYRSEASGTAGATASTRTDLDLGVGYLTPGGWLVGVLYGSDKTSTAPSYDRTALGLTGGWIASKNSGFYAMATYFLSVTRGDGASGSGHQIDFGYLFPVKSFAFGPQLSIRHLGYDKLNGDALTPNQIDDRIDPYFTFLMVF